jgi:hypothetical protein
MNPENELEEFLTSVPAWMRKTFETGFPSLSQPEINEWFGNFDELNRLKQEYERMLQSIPVKWRDYRKRLKREAEQSARFEAQFLVPKGKPGRPVDSKAKGYFEQHSCELSYADIAKQELQSEPEGQTKALLIPKESERIRASVRRSRRRQST